MPTLTSGPPAAPFSSGTMAAAQPEVVGPTTATTLSLRANARALRRHLAGSENASALASSQTWIATAWSPACQPRCCMTSLIACAFWIPWSLMAPCNGATSGTTNRGLPSAP